MTSEGFRGAAGRETKKHPGSLGCRRDEDAGETKKLRKAHSRQTEKAPPSGLACREKEPPLPGCKHLLVVSPGDTRSRCAFPQATGTVNDPMYGDKWEEACNEEHIGKRDGTFLL